ncbi:MAG: flagellar basal body-associated FliL family protein [Verrucomicrobiales bacterium]|nr:flagellar basal body-associated FliL family protein [Verrucomicrobiales bacterium]
MATNRVAAGNGEAGTETAAPATAGNSENGGGGLKSWLPLILNLVLMPALAYGMTVFVLLPKLGPSGEKTSASHSDGGGGHSEHGGKEAGGKGKFMVNLSGKILVNVAGTGGTRYLLATLTLVSPNADLKSAIEKNDAQLRDVASGVLASKTINDLEKPGARNLIRTELISVFNGVLGNGTVTELYLTEFAVQ